MDLTEFLSRNIYMPRDHSRGFQAWTLDYEMIHQLVLKAVMETCPEFLSELVPSSDRYCALEAHGRRYDLLLESRSSDVGVLFEIKTWSPLKEEQIKRQTAFAKQRHRTIKYLLLGPSGIQWPDEKIRHVTSNVGSKLRCGELIKLLSEIRGPAEPLAKSYMTALSAQRDRLAAQFGQQQDIDC